MHRNGIGSSGGGFLKVFALLIIAAFFCGQDPIGIASSGTGAGHVRPRIGILVVDSASATGTPAIHAPDRLRPYREAVASWGAVVVPVALKDPASVSAAVLTSLDGLLIPGGDDVDPMLYGERPHPKLETVHRAFDEFELAALKSVTDRGIPVLGICRGHQLMNVFRGGTLWQDIPSMNASDSRLAHRIRIDGRSAPCSHSIAIEPETLVGDLLSSPTIDVNSYHHQAVREPGRDLRITARAADDIVEAMESTTGPFFVGVQFHPEKMLPERAEFGRLFEAFVDAARRYRMMMKDMK
ncbi:MAG TPA: gamma-glutamyl-gamma-aminobutyrate hydrolase family protein [Candidatus Ozemobacteraceae bacterium]|nr:gamma-glutamyl-gamma-aminobutyrate hydrolase family protein [Candidatus Ozemobacteraceae bacterium]